MTEPRRAILDATADLGLLVVEDRQEHEGTWAEGTLAPVVAYGFERAAIVLSELAGVLEGAVLQTPEVRKVVGDLDRFADNLILTRNAVEAALARRGRTTEEKQADGDASVLRLSKWLDTRAVPFRRGRIEI